MVLSKKFQNMFHQFYPYCEYTCVVEHCFSSKIKFEKKKVHYAQQISYPKAVFDLKFN